MFIYMICVYICTHTQIVMRRAMLGGKAQLCPTILGLTNVVHPGALEWNSGRICTENTARQHERE